MRVLITGGVGFIGSAILRKFVENGHDVTVFDALTYSGFFDHIVGLTIPVPTPTPEFVRGDLRKMEDIDGCFQMYGPFDLVIHAAAESSVDRSIKGYDDFVTSNVLGSCNLFEVCRQHGVKRVINFATDEIYGHHSEGGDSAGRPSLESDPVAPRNIYSASKAAQLLFANAFHITHQVPILNVCPSNCYGPRQHVEKLIPKVIFCMLSGRPIPIYNEGKNIREWLYVDDAAAGILALALHGSPGETYNLGADESASVMEIVRYIAIAMKAFRLLPPGFQVLDAIELKPARKGDDFQYKVNSDKMIHACGWRPQTSLGQGLEETCKWFIKNQNWMNFAARRINL